MTQERLKECLSYDPKTGLFNWIARPARRVKLGAIAGCKDPRGYMVIYLDNGRYWAHRLAWLYIHGAFPKALDHRNGIRDDNRISNLREATPAENAANKRVIRSGLKGVRFHNENQNWCAVITKNYKQIHLGCFATEEEAHAAYVEAARKSFGEFARPR